MKHTLLLLALAACAAKSTPDAAPDAAPEAGAARAVTDASSSGSASDADLQAVTVRLSDRHPSNDCTALVEGLSDARTALRRAVDEVTMPPWVGLISGECLAVKYGAEEEALVTRWLTEADYAGLGRSIIRALPRVADEALAVRLGQAALRGPNAALATTELANDPRAAVRALVAP